jgi:myosin-3
MAKELNECIAAVGFTDVVRCSSILTVNLICRQEIDQLNCIMSAILHIGDFVCCVASFSVCLIALQAYEGDEEARFEDSNGPLAVVCNQLGLDKDQMQQAFTSSLSVTRGLSSGCPLSVLIPLQGETIVRPYKPFEADDVRDATAKGIYGRTFTWIVSRVNALLGPKSKQAGPKDKKIGILDIFGFECFQVNSYEQLLINLANEQLQFFFNNHIFKQEVRTPFPPIVSPCVFAMDVARLNLLLIASSSMKWRRRALTARPSHTRTTRRCWT